MPFNGSGVFTRLYSWVNDAAANIKIRADRMDNEMNGMATGLSNCITKDGQTTVTANLPMAGFRHTAIGDAVSRNQYASYAQLQDGKLLPTVGGTVDAITLTYSIPHTAYTNGMEISFISSGANTGAVTVNLDALGVRNITKNGTSALIAGDISSGELVVCRYDGTRFQLINDIQYIIPSDTITQAMMTDNSVGTNELINSNVTNAKLANMAANTVKVNATASSAVATDLALTANTFPARNSTGNISALPVTDFALSLLDDTTAAAARTTLGFPINNILLSGLLVSLTGSTVTIAGIPSGVRRITVMLTAASTNGTNNYQIQLSSGGTFVTTGYTGGNGGTASTTGFNIASGSAVNSWTGTTVINNTGNLVTWIASHSHWFGSGSAAGGGAVTMAGAVDGVRITTPDTFDAGSICVSWEF